MQLVVRALNVLRVVADSERGLSLQQLVVRLDIPLGSMHRLLAVLEEQRFVSRSPTNRRYFLGPAALGFADEGGQRRGLLATPHPVLAGLCEQTHQTVFLTELLGDTAVCVALAEGSSPLRLFARIGQELPLHASAAARILLAFEPAATAWRLLGNRPLTPFTGATPRSAEEVLDRLAVDRARGFDVSESELDVGVWTVSVPIRVSTGRVRASLSLAACADGSGTTADRGALLDAVVAAAGQISSDLGWDPPAETGSPSFDADLRGWTTP
jgi:DNA-binding IclR family transcriptional regulator